MAGALEKQYQCIRLCSDCKLEQEEEKDVQVTGQVRHSSSAHGIAHTHTCVNGTAKKNTHTHNTGANQQATLASVTQQDVHIITAQNE